MIHFISLLPKDLQIIVILSPYFTVIILIGIILKRGFSIIRNYLLFWLILLAVLTFYSITLSSKLSFLENPAVELLSYVLFVVAGFFSIKMQKKGTKK